MSVERVECMLGWAVFGGAEGDDPTFIGFFREHGTAEEFARSLQDPCVAPCVVNHGRLYAVNDFDVVRGCEDVARESGLALHPYHLHRFRQMCAQAWR